MALNLVKLCVGVRDVNHLARLQDLRWERQGRLYHVTRMTPRRTGELLDGGSLYWVIGGRILVRQRLIAIERFRDDEGIGRCRLVYDRERVLTHPRRRRAFQGWRYLTREDAPRDLESGGDNDLAPVMRAELAELGLL